MDRENFVSVGSRVEAVAPKELGLRERGAKQIAKLAAILEVMREVHVRICGIPKLGETDPTSVRAPDLPGETASLIELMDRSQTFLTDMDCLLTAILVRL
jgi:hypothetical protein